MATAYIGIGSNLGNRMANMVQAVRALGPKIQPASLYETSPVGGPDEQPNFLNSVVGRETDLTPDSMLKKLQEVEESMGRIRGEKWGPRTIDLDLLFFDQLVVNTPDLVIPHPRLTERGFVLVPLAELAPDLTPPQFKKSIRELCDDWAKSNTMDRVVRVCGPEWVDENAG